MSVSSTPVLGVIDRIALGLRADRALLRQVSSFAAMGLASSLLQGALYLALRLVATSSIAAAVSLILSTVANTAANRALTFQVTDRSGKARAQVLGLLLLGVTWAFQQAGLLLVTPFALSATGEAVAVVICGSFGGILRFILMRTWVFAPRGTAVA
ncbi:MAG TPA: GtrA family protein [Arachnia sp.]|nr:GtrA family protein [Arachnia sp.]HMT84769.1 GtrA family protein [Arachnia sp.]